MALNKVEQIAALSLLANNDHKDLAWLLETTNHLPAKQKVTALTALVRIAVDRDDKDARKQVLSVLTDPGPKVISFVRPADQASA
jgi:hypothetical protein